VSANEGRPSTELKKLKETLTSVDAAPVRIKRFAIEVISGPDAGVRCEVNELLRIGSHRLADLVLSDPHVSALHCELSVGAKVRVRDVSSKNGTFVGDVRLGEAEVPAGTVLLLGKTRLRIVDTHRTRELPVFAGHALHGLAGRSARMRALIARSRERRRWTRRC